MAKKTKGLDPGEISSEERAYKLFKALMDASTTNRYHDRVLEWFAGEAGEEEKQKAMIRYMYENLQPTTQPKESTVRKFNLLAGELGISLPDPSPVVGAGVSRAFPTRKVLRRVAAALIPIAIVLGIYLSVDRRADSAEILAEVVVEDTPGASRDVVLADGTSVTVASGSRLVYPDPFTGQRMVRLEGEATFNVVNTGGEPFTVAASDVTVTVLGTRFTVTDNARTGRTQVALYEGSVSVVSSAGSHVLERGQYFDFDSNTGQAAVTSISSRYMDMLGYTPSLKLDNVPLAEILFSVEKNFGVSFVVAKGIDMNGNYSVSYEGEPLDNILYALSGTLGLRFRSDGETVYVSK